MTIPPADLAVGTFSEHPPWLVEPAALRWRIGLDRIRARTRAEVPRLTRARRFPPLRRLAGTARHLGVPIAHWALTDRRRGRQVSRRGLSRRLRQASERLGPTYIKLAQIISAGEGLFPEELVSELKRCRDRVPPEPWDDVCRVVEEELGRPLEEVFATFDRTPLAAASIAQVHVATLVTGEEVVAKVQRPQVAELVGRDLAMMSWLAPALVGRIPVASLANPPALVELFADTISEELDFRLEAENMLDVARMLAELGQRQFVVPRPHPELVTRRLLVMERLSGFAFDDVAGMKGAGVDTEAVVRTGMIAFLEGAMLHGIFHGDLHGGNLFVQPDGRTALLDYGITGRLDEPRRLAFLRLLMASITNDVQTELAALRDLGALPADADLAAVTRDLRLDQPAIDPTSLTGDELVAELRRVVKALLGYGARLPKELMLFVKNMVFLDGAIATLAPDLDLFAEIGNVAAHFATAHGERLSHDIGLDSRAVQVDLTGVKAGFGVTPETEGLTYRELQQRRDVIRSRFGERHPGGRARIRRRARGED
ncbi:MAG: AarF/ABC1/UbiB kinase family protein [Actinobacteria bacterium]|nr:AarF/ABC1/UbiB kinase family protein [Actinomycetota bacterium]